MKKPIAAVCVVGIALLVGPGWSAEPETKSGAPKMAPRQALRLERATTGLDEVPLGKYLVAKDSAGSLYLLDSHERMVLEFGPKGQSRGRIKLPAPPGEPMGESYVAFDVSPGGRWFALSTAEQVSVFQDDQLFMTISFGDPPALVMSVALLDETPHTAMARMFLAPVRAFPSLLKSNHVLVTADRAGQVEPFAVPLELDEDTKVPLASLKEICDLQVDEKGRVWAADKARFRVRGFSPSGALRRELTDEDVQLGIEEHPFKPNEAGIGQDLAGNESKTTGLSGSMKTAIRAFDVADGRVWLIANDDTAPERQRFDIVDIDTGATHSLPLSEGLPPFGTVAVTDRLIVFGTNSDTGRPVAFDRYALDLALQELEPSRLLTARDAPDEAAAEEHGDTAP